MSTKYPEDYPLSARQLDDKYNPEGYGEHPGYTRENWRDAVANDETLQGYWDWVYYSLTQEMEAEDEEEDDE